MAQLGAAATAFSAMPCTMWWPASAQSELMKSGAPAPIALNTGRPIFIATGCVAVFTP